MGGGQRRARGGGLEDAAAVLESEAQAAAGLGDLRRSIS